MYNTEMLGMGMEMGMRLECAYTPVYVLYMCMLVGTLTCRIFAYTCTCCRSELESPSAGDRPLNKGNLKEA